MSEERFAKVRAALEAEDDEAMARAVDALDDADSLHQFLLNYNVNDGFLPCLALARHPKLDRGTASHLYFLFLDLLFDPEERANHRKKRLEWNADAVLTTLEERLSKGGFASADIRWHPGEIHALNRLQHRRLLAAGVAEEWFSNVGERKVERKWLL